MKSVFVLFCYFSFNFVGVLILTNGRFFLFSFSHEWVLCEKKPVENFPSLEQKHLHFASELIQHGEYLFGCMIENFTEYFRKQITTGND